MPHSSNRSLIAECEKTRKAACEMRSEVEESTAQAVDKSRRQMAKSEKLLERTRARQI
jgi:hypothetical protein